MNALQIQSVVESDRKLRNIFLGIYPADKLPISVNTFPSALIANVDNHREPGSHWVAIYFNKYGKASFFDSFGRHPAMCSPHFQTFLSKHSHDWIYNKRSLQSHWSSVCGHYCLYFLIHAVRGHSLHGIVSRFTLNRTQNDRMVYAYIHSRHKLNVPMYDANFILQSILDT